MVIDVSVVRPCMQQLNSDQSMDQGIGKECGQWCWIWAKVSDSPEEESTKNITCCRIGYKIGCTEDWFMMKISATTSMQLLPTHKHKNVSDEFFSTLYLLS